MTGKEFLEAVTNGRVDVIELSLGLLRDLDAPYAMIGGLAVNAYAEPVVSLDLDLVVVTERLDHLVEAARGRGMKAETFAYSVRLSISGSDLRIQLQTAPRYQAFIARATTRTVLGYEMSVAALEDVVRGKVCAYTDTSRRRSKRQKDLADLLPPEIAAELS